MSVESEEVPHSAVMEGQEGHTENVEEPKVIPDRNGQREEIQKIEKEEKLQAGGKAYLINTDWYSKWKRYTNNSYQSSTKPNGAIDNSKLLDAQGKFNTNKAEGHDYMILVKGIWDKLVEWYGGGPEVTVDCVYDERTKTVKAITRPLVIKVHYGDTCKEISTHKYQTVANFKKMLMELFEVDESKETRVIDWWQKRMTTVLSDEKSMMEYNIIANQDVLLDEKDEDGNWKKKQQTTSSSYSYSAPEYKGPGKVGLRNLGNTCFFNSGVQCLMHTMGLMHVFLRTNWEQDLNEKNPLGSRCKVVKAFAKVVNKIWKVESGVADPGDLKYEMGCFAQQFQGYQQHDSHELLTFMLDAIHEDLNRRKVKPAVERQTGDGSNDIEIAKKEWENHKARNDSVIVDLFHGQLRSMNHCPNCKKLTTVFDPYVSVSLPLQKKATTHRIHAMFVPANLEELRFNVTVNLTSGSPEAVSDAISNLIGKKINAVLFSFVDDDTLAYGLTNDDSDYVIAEISDTSKLYVPCYICTKDMYGRDKPIYGPFMVPTESINPSMKDISNSCEQVCSFLWKEERQNITLTWDEESMKRQIILPTKPLTDGAKMEAFLYGRRTITKDRQYSHLCTSLVYIRLGGNYCTEEAGFDLDDWVRVGMRREQPLIASEPANQSTGVTLDSCFENFSSLGVLDEDNKWFCPHCREFVCAEKKMELWTVPDIMMIHLKRFIQSGYYTKKLDTPVSYPDEIDMSKYIVGPHDGPQKYKLYAVSEHMGTMYGGHYIAHAVVQDKQGGEKWYEFNDSSCHETSAAEAHNPLAYVLFYVREGSEHSHMSTWSDAPPEPVSAPPEPVSAPVPPPPPPLPPSMYQHVDQSSNQNDAPTLGEDTENGNVGASEEPFDSMLDID